MCDHNGIINFVNTCNQVVASSPTSVDFNDTLFHGFRGFQKVPLVLIERADITPYLITAPPVKSPPKPRIKWKIRPTKKPLIRQEKTKRPRSKPSRKLASNEPQSNIAGAVKIPPSFVDCSSKLSVQLFRDDLEELKKIFKKSPTEFDNPSSRLPRMSLRCNICGKLYSSDKKLQNHQDKKHMIIYKPEKNRSLKRVSFSDKVIVHELKEYHKCRKCPKIFENYKVLKSHMKEQHKKRKCYICYYCTKKFVDRMFFKVHIKLHCDFCGLLFSSKSKCNDHKRNICKTLKFHKCKTCSLNFYKLMDLKDHSYEHNGNTCFVCDICKDQCPSKCAVAHHIYSLHSKRPNSFNLSLYITKKIVRESLFLCRFCEESSVDRDLIEKHVELLPDLSNRAMTGYKDYYFCDQCLKQFDTESDMLQHKWTHFLKTSDNSQERSKSIQVKKRKLNTFYNIKKGIPDYFQPKIVLEKLKVDRQPMTGPAESVGGEPVTVPIEPVGAQPVNGPVEFVGAQPVTGPVESVGAQPVTGLVESFQPKIILEKLKVGGQPKTGPAVSVGGQPVTVPVEPVGAQPVIGPVEFVGAQPVTGPVESVGAQPVTGLVESFQPKIILEKLKVGGKPETGPAESAGGQPVTVPVEPVGAQPVNGPLESVGAQPVTGPVESVGAQPVTGLVESFQPKIILEKLKVGGQPKTGPAESVGGQPVTVPVEPVGAQPVNGPLESVGAQPVTGPVESDGGQTETGPVESDGGQTVTGPVESVGEQPLTGPVEYFGGLHVTDPIESVCAQLVAGPEESVGVQPVTGPVESVDALPLMGPVEYVDGQPVIGPVEYVSELPVTGPIESVGAQPVADPVESISAQPVTGPIEYVCGQSVTGPMESVSGQPIAGPVEYVGAQAVSGPVEYVGGQTVTGPIESIGAQTMAGPVEYDGVQPVTSPVEYVGVIDDIPNGNSNKPIVDPKSKKTLISKHRCETCGKYYSTNYCLNRHIETQHSDYENLRCGVCEEVFVWPSLLRSHKCIRLQIPEMPFEDARPEIHFDNLHEVSLQSLVNGGTELPTCFDDLNIDISDDYLNSVDFDIPTPIAELTEQENSLLPAVQNGEMNPNLKLNALQNLGYKIVMQEVPIEF